MCLLFDWIVRWGIEVLGDDVIAHCVSLSKLMLLWICVASNVVCRTG